MISRMPANERKLDTLQAIELAEGVEIRLRIAGPILRMWAWILDSIFIIVAILVISMILGFAGMLIGGRVVQGVMMLTWFLLSWWYPVLFEASKWGATFGKRICGLRVIQPSGTPISMGQSIVRNFLRVIDCLPFYTCIFGLVSIVATKRFQRLGDLAAGTVVVYERNETVPEGSGPPPLQAIRPHVKLAPEEARAIVTFRERAVYWSEARRREIADHLQILSGGNGSNGVAKLMAMAHWLQEKR